MTTIGVPSVRYFTDQPRVGIVGGRWPSYVSNQAIATTTYRVDSNGYAVSLEPAGAAFPSPEMLRGPSIAFSARAPKVPVDRTLPRDHKATTKGLASARPVNSGRRQ